MCIAITRSYRGNRVPSLRSGQEKVTTTSKSDLYRLLPSVDELLKSADLAELLAREGQPAVTESVRAVLASLRNEINSSTLSTQQAVELAVEHLPQAVEQHLSHAMEFSLRPVINATGVILHTNLGRAPLAESAIRRIAVAIWSSAASHEISSHPGSESPFGRVRRSGRFSLSL